jgi:hypothetical protein
LPQLALLQAGRVTFRHIVEYLEFGQAGKKINKIPSAVIIPLANLPLGNAMPASRDLRSYPLNMQFDTLQTDIPIADLDSGFCGLPQQPGHRIATKSGLKSKILTGTNRAL